VVTTAERLGINELATFDRRHFTIIRPRHIETLTLLP
jgi:predicted nucleic acid-binding protein